MAKFQWWNKNYLQSLFNEKHFTFKEIGNDINYHDIPWPNYLKWFDEAPPIYIIYLNIPTLTINSVGTSYSNKIDDDKVLIGTGNGLYLYRTHDVSLKKLTDDQLLINMHLWEKFSLPSLGIPVEHIVPFGNKESYKVEWYNPTTIKKLFSEYYYKIKDLSKDNISSGGNKVIYEIEINSSSEKKLFVTDNGLFLQDWECNNIKLTKDEPNDLIIDESKWEENDLPLLGEYVSKISYVIPNE